ncbi:MAG: adenylosuccinate lyase [Clostridia bacterium]|nr:adenylosuccinate lyase [Clostridia bacterium]
MHEIYESILPKRYASEEMAELFSDDRRYRTWRRLWVSLAGAESRLGLPVTDEQVAELEQNIDNIDYECVSQREALVHHDVMAHIYAFGKAAPKAAGIIHLGATSCYVTDNADLILYRDALEILRGRLIKLIAILCRFSKTYSTTPALGYTHYQPAQPVTVGKRACLWIQDLKSDLDELDFVMSSIKFLGCRGTTGTEASFMDLFEGETDKIDEMNRMIAQDFGFSECFPISSQTYPRKLDVRILNCLSSIAQSMCKMATDIRLLQHDGILEEPFGQSQIGSSAMAYKRNPMRCERICSLSRYLISDAFNAVQTASNQWLERTLDDSANRRLAMPEGFMTADSILILGAYVVSGLRVNEKLTERSVKDLLPFLATEDILMEGVKRGGDRQALHEVIRKVSMDAVEAKRSGEPYDLISHLACENGFNMTEEEMRSILDPQKFIGRSEEQTLRYLRELEPLTEGVDMEVKEITA